MPGKTIKVKLTNDNWDRGDLGKGEMLTHEGGMCILGHLCTALEVPPYKGQLLPDDNQYDALRDVGVVFSTAKYLADVNDRGRQDDGEKLDSFRELLKGSGVEVEYEG